MDRRGFLRAVGLTTGAIFVPDFLLVIPEQNIPQDLSWFATARELIQYDLPTDAVLMRHDILGRETQLFVDQKYGSKEELVLRIGNARTLAAELLGNEMKRRKMRIDELRPLPIPLGYVTPNWLKA